MSTKHTLLVFDSFFNVALFPYQLLDQQYTMHKTAKKSINIAGIKQPWDKNSSPKKDYQKYKNTKISFMTSDKKAENVKSQKLL